MDFLGPGSHKADENDHEARHGREDFGVLQQRSTAVQRIESTLEVLWLVRGRNLDFPIDFGTQAEKKTAFNQI